MKIVLLVLCLLTPFLGGCYVYYTCSFPLAPAISEPDKQMVDRAHFDSSISITGKEFFVSEIQDIGLFDDVGLYVSEPNCFDYDLVIEYEEGGNYANPLPFFTFLTLGLFPTIADDERGYVFNIYRCDMPGNKVQIDCRYKGKAVMGWYALIVSSTTPNQSLIMPFSGCDSEKSEDQLFNDYLKWKIVQKQDDIKQLLR